MDVVFYSSTIFMDIHCERHAGAGVGTCMPPGYTLIRSAVVAIG